MKKIIIRLLKILGGIVAAFMLLMVIAGLLLNTDAVQNKLMSFSTRVLSEKLETTVSIDSISVGFFANDLKLKGVSIEDREQRKMFEMERLTVSMELWPLLKKEVKISSAKISGLKAELYKPADGPANYQFVLDAFKKDKPKEAVEDEEPEKKKKKKLELNVNSAVLERISVKYNNSEAELDQVQYEENLLGWREGKLTGLKVKWVAKTKKGPQDCTASISQLTLHEKNKQGKVDISGLRFSNDNHLPRKNVGKPQRGAFDNGHIDAVAHIQLSFSEPVDGKIPVKMDHCEVTDQTAGIHIKNITLSLIASKEMLWIKDIDIRLDNTTVKVESAEMQLPSKKRGVKLGYKTSVIRGETLLKDISKPFAPILKDFSIPLLFSAKMIGDDYSMKFTDISVSTADKKLEIAATGGIKELKDKYKLDVRFHVSHMRARGDIKARIINQFPVKKFMMKQLDALGDIGFVGDITVLWKRELFNGVLNTAAGKLNFDFGINENTKYLTGNIKTAGIDIGRVFDMDELGPIMCGASFTFDISKPRTAIMRRKKGGKLPIGSVHAKVDEASYKKIKFHNLIADIESDGAVAEGKLTLKGKRTDVLCSFNFTNTDSIKSKLKFKPGIRFHGLSEEAKQAKAEKKQKKKEEKELRKQQKTEEKARKAEEKARKAEEKAARKAAKKAAKEAAKEAKKAKKAKNHSENNT